MHKGQVIMRPIMTEQSMKEAENGKFSFAVNLGSSKNDIKKAVEDAFGVTVVSVKTQRLKGRTKRVGQRRLEVVSSPAKKATVEVKKGEKIDIFTAGK